MTHPEVNNLPRKLSDLPKRLTKRLDDSGVSGSKVMLESLALSSPVPEPPSVPSAPNTELNSSWALNARSFSVLCNWEMTKFSSRTGLYHFLPPVYPEVSLDILEMETKQTPILVQVAILLLMMSVPHDTLPGSQGPTQQASSLDWMPYFFSGWWRDLNDQVIP